MHASIKGFKWMSRRILISWHYIRAANKISFAFNNLIFVICGYSSFCGFFYRKMSKMGIFQIYFIALADKWRGAFSLWVSSVFNNQILGMIRP
jgi:hypothetical protein